ncbi:hypothetical protein IM40_02575 [Candidatus Paracaedimonas acanthamoebae]|nr:hypothetical protein IM40_02575 [Candidatus Paracaedimonas acanthamoebae]
MDAPKRLMYTRQLTNMPRTVFCRKYDVSPSSLAKWELGAKELSLRSARKLSLIFEKEGISVTPEWLLNGEGEAARKARTISNRKGAEAIATEKDLIEEELQKFEAFHENILSLKIYDDSCFPIYIPGDYVAGVALEGENMLTLRERICIVQLLNGVICVRKIMDYQDVDNTFDLECINPYTEIAQKTLKAAQLISAAPITFFRRVSS